MRTYPKYKITKNYRGFIPDSTRFIAQKNNPLYGLIDGQNNILIEFEYENIEPVVDTNLSARVVYLVTKKNKQGIIDDQGHILTYFKFDEIKIFPFFIKGVEEIYYSNDATRADIFKAKKNGKWGIISFDGQYLTEFVYDDISNMKEFFNATKTDGDKGVTDIITSNGTIVASFEDSKLYYLGSGRKNYFYENKKLIGFLDTNFRIITPLLYENIEAISVTNSNENSQSGFGKFFDCSGLYSFIRNGLFGFVDYNGIEVISPKYTEIGPFINGYITVYIKDKVYGAVDLSGKEILPCQYDRIFGFTEGLFCVFGYGSSKQNKKKGCGFIDVNNKIVVPLIYESVTFFSGGKSRVKDKNGYKYDIDKKGNKWVN